MILDAGASASDERRVIKVEAEGVNLIGLTITGGYSLTPGQNSGGGIYVSSQEVNVISCEIHGNLAINGGGIYGGGFFNLVDSTIRANFAAAGNGGGLHGDKFHILRSTFDGNGACGASGFNPATWQVPSQSCASHHSLLSLVSPLASAHTALSALTGKSGGKRMRLRFERDGLSDLRGDAARRRSCHDHRLHLRQHGRPSLR